MFAYQRLGTHSQPCLIGFGSHAIFITEVIYAKSGLLLEGENEGMEKAEKSWKVEKVEYTLKDDTMQLQASSAMFPRAV